MLTEFQRKKIAYHFEIIDFDKDGFLTREDLYNHGAAYADLMQVPQESIIKKELEWWDKMNECLGIDKERPITEAEHLKAFEIVMCNSDFLPVFLWDYMELIWSYLKLEKSDYLPFHNFAGVMVSDEGDEAKEIFSLLDQEKRGKLSIQELYGYWLSFFYSNNPECPSKWVFGKFNLKT